MPANLRAVCAIAAAQRGIDGDPRRPCAPLRRRAAAPHGTPREVDRDTMAEPTPHVSVVPFYPTGSTFLVGMEVVQWTVYTVGVIMLLVVLMMQ
jgi:hypothetical protein